MSIFYDSLPLPIFLGVTFVVPVLIALHFYQKRTEYPFAALIGIVFLCLTAVSAGVVRIFIELKLFEEYSDWFGAIPLPFILLTIPFILAGAYQKVRHDKVRRKQVVLISLGLFIIILYVALLSAFKLNR